MEFKNIIKEKIADKQFVKIKCIDKTYKIYALKAQCDFEIFNKKIHKGDLSGKMILDCDVDDLTFNGPNWIEETTMVHFCNVCTLKNTYFHRINKEIVVDNSDISNSVIYIDGLWFNRKVSIVDSIISRSNFILKPIFGTENDISIIFSRVINCNFYTLQDVSVKFFTLDALDVCNIRIPSNKGLNIFKIKHSTIKNAICLSNVCVDTSKVNDSERDNTLYVEGNFLLYCSCLYFHYPEAYLQFSNVEKTAYLPCLSNDKIGSAYLPHLSSNLVAKKYTHIIGVDNEKNNPDTATNNVLIKTSDENEEKICMKFANIEPEILNSYNALMITKKDEMKNNIEISKDEIEQNKHLEELIKKARELGIEI